MLATQISLAPHFSIFLWMIFTSKENALFYDFIDMLSLQTANSAPTFLRPLVRLGRTSKPSRPKISENPGWEIGIPRSKKSPNCCDVDLLSIFERHIHIFLYIYTYIHIQCIYIYIYVDRCIYHNSVPASVCMCVNVYLYLYTQLCTFSYAYGTKCINIIDWPPMFFCQATFPSIWIHQALQEFLEKKRQKNELPVCADADLLVSSGKQVGIPWKWPYFLENDLTSGLIRSWITMFYHNLFAWESNTWKYMLFFQLTYRWPC